MGNGTTSNVTVHVGKALNVLRAMPDESVHNVITDPPYGLANTTPAQVLDCLTHWVGGDREYVPGGRGFMGHEWDAFVPPPALWDECMRVLKPGGHLFAFAGSRTYDLMGLSIRLAGFDIRDGITWCYGSGFPKSMDVSKAIDKAAGAERKVTGTAVYGDGHVQRSAESIGYHGSDPTADLRIVTAPATDDAQHWSGWGTALKPASEPIVVARKPFQGTVASNVLAHGTGALNIDACRVATTDNLNGGAYSEGGNRKALDGDSRDAKGQGMYAEGAGRIPGAYVQPAGRWPANVVLSHTPECVEVGTRTVRSNAQKDDDAAGEWTGTALSGSVDGSLNGTRSAGYGDADGMESVAAFECAPGCPVAELDAQSGDLSVNRPVTWRGGTGTSDGWGNVGKAEPGEVRSGYGDTGGASRFFPVFRYQAKAPTRERPSYTADDGKDWTWVEQQSAATTKVAHPTVKPLALMRWLVRLVAAPGTVVLDPFVGSGTTAEACALEGVACIAVESHLPYLPLIEQRLERVGATAEWVGRPVPVDPDAERRRDPDALRRGLLARLRDGLVEHALSLPDVAPTLLERVQSCGSPDAARALWREQRGEWTSEHTAAARALV